MNRKSQLEVLKTKIPYFPPSNSFPQATFKLFRIVDKIVQFFPVLFLPQKLGTADSFSLSPGGLGSLSSVCYLVPDVMQNIPANLWAQLKMMETENEHVTPGTSHFSIDAVNNACPHHWLIPTSTYLSRPIIWVDRDERSIIISISSRPC